MGPASTTPHLPLVRATAFLPFVAFLRDLGTPVERRLRAAKLPIGVVGDPAVLIPLRNACRFLEDASRSEDLPELGFHVGLGTRLESLGAVGAVVDRAVTLWQALGTLEQLAATMSSGFCVRLERDRDHVWIEHRNLMPNACGSAHGDDFGLMMVLHLIRLAAGPTWQPRFVRLQAPPDHRIGDLDVFRAASPQFRQRANAVAVPASLLSRPLMSLAPRRGDPPPLSAEQLRSTTPVRDLCASITQFLRAQFPDGHADIRAVAEAAGCSVRTLQRRLRADGEDYAGLLDRVRFERALALLGDPGLPIVAIALELGYGDAANFTRAFRRWTGLSPSAFRKLAEHPEAAHSGR